MHNKLYLPDDIWHLIWKYLYPIKDLKNSNITNSINNILINTTYCIKCGENNYADKCCFCKIIKYCRCKKCSHIEGSDFICCLESYNKYGMIN